MPAELLAVDKQAVARRFNRSAATYDDNCAVQRGMADRLAAGLDSILPRPRWILELGCGTGYLTGVLAQKLPGSRILAVDFAERMLGIARLRIPLPRVDFELADAETASFEGAAFDLVISNATIQWFDAPAESLPRLASCLRPGGRMVHSTFGPATFRELKSVLRASGGEEEAFLGLPLRPAEEWQSMMAGSGLHGVSCSRAIQVEHLPSAGVFLSRLHATGATYRPPITGRERVSPRELSKTLARYDARFGSPEGVPVTYELVQLAGRLRA